MRKLRLHLDHLAVQSFSPAPAARLRGTAVAHEAESLITDPGDPGGGDPGDTQPGMNCFTCELTCEGRGC